MMIKHFEQHIDIPDNIAEYISKTNGANVAWNINSAFADGEYAHMFWISVVVSRLTRTCNRCGYDPLWQPNDDGSKCQRHTYNSPRYDDVFVWSPEDNNLSLEEAFNVWLTSQPDRWDMPTKFMALVDLDGEHARNIN
ncbi:MAG: hypothetical protein II767_13520 [Proteobacteria bacterium]|nr:hypothetical protein [Pseudomonadota bacterium]